MKSTLPAKQLHVRRDKRHSTSRGRCVATNLVAFYLPQCIAGLTVLRYGYEPFLVILAAAYGVGAILSAGNQFFAVFLGILEFNLTLGVVLWISLVRNADRVVARIITAVIFGFGAIHALIGVGLISFSRISW